MENFEIVTPRLRLVPGNFELSRAEIDDRGRFAELLGADVPDAWPPPLNSVDSMEYTAEFFKQNPGMREWMVWYFILCGSDGKNDIVIGNGGFKGAPRPDGTVEVGYSVIEEYRRRGLASEAVRGFLEWSFGHTEVTRVIAETLPELLPSQVVLNKCRFRFTGEGSEPGVLRYEITREMYEGETESASSHTNILHQRL